MYCFTTYTNGNFYREQSDSIFRVIRKKMKKIWAIIRNKDFYYSDVIMTKDDFKEFRSYINRVDVARIPFGINDDYIINKRYPRDPCANCSNNHKNGGSGVCHCILGQKWFY